MTTFHAVALKLLAVVFIAVPAVMAVTGASAYSIVACALFGISQVIVYDTNPP